MVGDKSMFVTGSMSQKSGLGHKTYKMGSVLPVLNANKLFDTVRHQGLLKQLRNMVFIDDEAYAHFYESTLNSFAEFVQVLPSQPSGALSGLLNEGLARSVIAVKNYLTSGANADPLVMYAVFTAALYRDLYFVVTGHRAILTEEEGLLVDVWQPFNGSMLGQAEFYKLYPLAPIYQRLDKSLSIVFARQIMPTDGFAWISSDLKILADWMDVLSGETGQGGVVSHIFSIMRPEDVLNLLNALVQVPVEMKVSNDTEFGDMFYAWLKAGIESGEIPINTAEAGVHVTVDGVFLEFNKVYHHFAAQATLPLNRNIVYTQFGNLFGIAKKGGGDFLHAQYFSDNPARAAGKSMAFTASLNTPQRTLREGMILGDPAMLFMHAQIPAVSPLMKAMQPKIPGSHQVPSLSGNGSNLTIGPAPSRD